MNVSREQLSKSEEIESTTMMEDRPVFVTGPDRSGTSLMFALLASHPNISMVRRTNMWRWFYGQFGDLNDRDNFERCLTAMLRYKRLRYLKPDPERIRREFWQGEPSYGRLFALFHRHHAQRAGKPRWADKSLHTEHYADTIFSEFPQARIIHMMRDPRDRYASVLKRYDDEEKGIGAVTGRWRASTKMARRNAQHYPDRYLTVRYESLAQFPEETMREVCAFIDERYTPAILTMKGAPEYRNAGGNSSFTTFDPGTISTRSIGRFREVVADRDVAFMQICVGQEMVAFDYPLETIEMSPVERSRFYVVDLPVNLIRLTGWLTLDKFRRMRGRTVPEHHLRNGGH